MFEYWSKILPPLLDGFSISLLVYSLTMIFALPIGLFIGLISDLYKPSHKVIRVFTWIVRGTPLLLQLYVMMYAVPLVLPFKMNRLFAGALTFIINYAAYFTEIFRSGLTIIPSGQWQATEVLGLNKREAIWYVILPQMFRNTLLPLINEAITLVKDTSLLATIAIGEMLRNAKEIVSNDFKIDALVLAGLIYLLFSLVVVQIGKKLESMYLMRR